MVKQQKPKQTFTKDIGRIFTKDELKQAKQQTALATLKKVLKFCTRKEEFRYWHINNIINYLEEEIKSLEMKK